MRPPVIVHGLAAVGEPGPDDPMPTVAVWTLGPMLIGAGLLLVWVGYRAWRGRLARNWVAGIRTRLTLSSDTAWDAAHRVGGPWMMAAGAASVIPGIAVLFRPPNRLGPMIIMVGMALVVAFVFIGAALGQMAARSAVDGVDGESGGSEA